MSSFLHVEVCQDPFFEKYYSASTQPPFVPFTFQKGDRLVMIGDSITEARRFSLMLETYLSVCTPQLGIEVRNIGKGGETAEGFLERMNNECLRYQPTAAVVCYGMNDTGYASNNRVAADHYSAATARIITNLISAGVRVILSSPGCIGKLPPDDYMPDAHGTMDGINTTLRFIRDEAAAIATAEKISFVDHFWNMYKARINSIMMYGDDYAVCGADDGVHPSWAGHVVMAYGYFKALGINGDLGTIVIDLVKKTAITQGGHTFIGELNGLYTFRSTNYPFCADGVPDKDWSIRSGMTLVPFNHEFNRIVLKVTGINTSRYRVSWMNHLNMLEEWHTYTDAELFEGINLAEDFHLNPFSIPFNRLNELIFQKQGIESDETWHTWEALGASAEVGLAECESQRKELRKAIEHAFVPVIHNIRLEAI